MDAADLLLWSQISGGFAAAVGVLAAFMAVPRALWQNAEQRRSQAALSFHAARRTAIDSCLALMKAIETRRAGVIALDPANKTGDWTVVEIISVELAFDQFRSDLAEALRLFVRAGRVVESGDLLGVYRCAKHLWVVADVHASTSADEIEIELGRKVYRHDFEMLGYQCHIITEFLNDELEAHPAVIRLKRAHPKAGLSMDYEFEEVRQARG